MYVIHKYASCTSSRWCFLGLLRSYQLEVQDQIKIYQIILIVEKSDSKGFKTNLECRKVKFETNHIKNRAKATKCASTLLYFLSYQLDVQDQIEK